MNNIKPSLSVNYKTIFKDEEIDIICLAFIKNLMGQKRCYNKIFYENPSLYGTGENFHSIQKHRKSILKRNNVEYE